jgi:general secretion pathway protein I
MRRPPRTAARCLRRGTRHAARGFTLIEVLVALVVVAVTLATGIKAAGALTANAERLAAVSAAEWCADNRLTAIRLAREFPGTGDFDFACDQLGAGYRGQLVVRPLPNPNFRRVDVRMADAAGLPLYTLSTIVPRNY